MVITVVTVINVFFMIDDLVFFFHSRSSPSPFTRPICELADGKFNGQTVTGSWCLPLLTLDLSGPQLILIILDLGCCKCNGFGIANVFRFRFGVFVSVLRLGRKLRPSLFWLPSYAPKFCSLFCSVHQFFLVDVFVLHIGLYSNWPDVFEDYLWDFLFSFVIYYIRSVLYAIILIQSVMTNLSK